MKKYTLTKILIMVFVISGMAKAESIFQQNFDDGGTTADYLSGGTASGGLFTDISANADGTVAITSNKLVIGTPQTATSTGSYDSGWGITGLTLNSGDIMRFDVDINFTITEGSGDSGPMGSITFGDYNGSHTAYPHDSNKFAAIGLRRVGTALRFEPLNGSNFEVNYGETNTLSVFMNDTGVAQTYVGPDGGTYSLSVSNEVDSNTNPYVQGSYAVWIGNSIMGDDIAATTFTHSTGHNSSGVLDTVMMYANSDADVGLETTFDNFEIASIPEPSTFILSLMAMGSLVLLRRRK